VTLGNTRLQVSGSVVHLDDDLRLRSLDARADAAGSLVLRGAGERTVTLTESSDTALLLRATNKLEIQETLSIKGSGGDAVIRPASGARPMVIGSGLFNTSGALHVDIKDGFAGTIYDFGRLILGSTSQTADIFIGERTTTTRSGHVFADPLEVRVAASASPAKVVTQGRLNGESFTVASGGLFQSSGSTLDFSESVRFDSPVQIVGNTVIESKTIDFNAVVSGVSAPLPVATLTLRPDSPAAPIGLGSGPAGSYVLDAGSLQALGGVDGLRFDLVIGHATQAQGVKLGDVSVSGTLDVDGTLSVFGSSLAMASGSKLAGARVDLRFDGSGDNGGNVTIARVEADTNVTVQSLKGRVLATDTSIVNLAGRGDGVLDSVVFYGRGSNVASADRALRVAADQARVELPGGRIDAVRLADGSMQYQGVDSRGIYRQLVIVDGQGRTSTALEDKAGDDWRLQRTGVSAATERKLVYTQPNVKSLAAAEDITPKSLNAATLAYLSAAGGAYERVSVGSGTAGLADERSPLDTLFDPLETDRVTGDPGLLEHAWLLGSSSYLPDALGLDSVGGAAYETWSEDELEI
jgi:hypothetical protein